MVDYQALMRILSQPRPNGSAQEAQTRKALLAWLNQNGIRYRLQPFRIYPHFWLILGLWLIISRSLLAWATWQRLGWPVFWIALIGLVGGLIDVAFNFPLITWPGSKLGQNILIEFIPAQPVQELVICAHYDSKTELLDHRQRMFFIKSLPIGILLTALVGILGPLVFNLIQLGSSLALPLFGVAMILSFFLVFLAWGLGLNLSLGGLRAKLGSESQGAVDNGAACAILLGLARRITDNQDLSGRTTLTLALFTGEEINMLGSRAYVRNHDWNLPSAALNMEVMGQNGEYVLWEKDGYSLKLWPCSLALNQILVEIIVKVTGSKPLFVGPVNSDAGSFLRKNIPATALGTYDQELRDRGFHGPQDQLERVVLARLPEAVEILTRLIERINLVGLPITEKVDL